MERIGTREKGGAALITAIVFVFFLTLFGLAFYRLGETDIDLFGHEEDLSQAFYASEAGIEKVRWMLREVPDPDANPFSTAYNEENAKSIANPTSGDFFPGVADTPYFRVASIQAAGSKVKVQILGSVDVDADGVIGLTTTEDGFTFDPDDVNRTFEAHVGLPGTLGEDVSAAAQAFYSGGVEVSLLQENRLFKTPDGDSINGFLYFGSGTFGLWDQWGFIFSDPVKTGEIELPPGIFDEAGEYVDEDTDGIPDYFQHLDPRMYVGLPTYDFDADNDPTAGAEGRSIIYADGDITITGVDFGYLNDQGDVKACDWEGYPPERIDLTFIANGDITVNRVDCGNVGRLVLVAKNITLVGNYSTKVNGIAIAYNDITLDGSGCTSEILTDPDTDRPVKYTAYFLGSMVAGNHIELQREGWTVIYDQNVINGYMYSSAADSIPKPTLTYELVETEDFDTNNNWDLNGFDFKVEQEDYIQEDIDSGQADSGDGGVDGIPELMKLYQEPRWSTDPAWPDKHEFGVTDGVRCDFTDVGNVFEDSDINIGLQDWDNYTTIRFYLALDNWQKTAGSKTTHRKSLLQVRLEDTAGNRVPYNVPYQNNDWVGAPGKAHWEFVRINPHDLDPLDPFDSRSVTRIEFYWKNIEVSWYIDDQTELISFINEYDHWAGKDGYYNYRRFDLKDFPVKFKPEDANGRRQLYYTDAGVDKDIQWNWDPSTSTLENMYFEDTLDPLKSALVSVFKIDRLELPGKPATNDHLEYGLPRCLRLEVSNWHEFQ